MRFDVQLNTWDIRMKLNIYSTTCKVQCDSAESQDWQINMSAVIMFTTVSGYEAAQWSEWKLYSIMKIIYCIYLMSNDSLFMFLCFGVWLCDEQMLLHRLRWKRGFAPEAGLMENWRQLLVFCCSWTAEIPGHITHSLAAFLQQTLNIVMILFIDNNNKKKKKHNNN